MNKTYTVKEVAKILGFSTNTIYTFLQEGRLRGVRVGSGRFRISEEELNRVLNLSKNPEVPNITQGEIEEKGQNIANSSGSTFQIFSVHVSSIFDWFIGSAAIVIGVSLFLYGSLKSRLDFIGFMPWIRTFEISFIAGGLGIIITDMFHKKIPLIWHWAFHIILLLAYGGFAFANFQINDRVAFLMFGLVALVILVKFFIRISGVMSFLIFLIMYLVGLSIEFWLGSYIPPQADFIQIITENKILFGLLWLFLLVLVSLPILLGAKKPNKLFWVSIILVGSMLILDSVFYANRLSWSKGFFSLTSGLTCFLTPIWIVLQEVRENRRDTLVFIFAVMIGTLVIGIATIFLMQGNMAELAAKDLRGRLRFAHIMVENNISALEDNLKNLNSNEALVEAVKEEDNERLTNLLKLIYNNNDIVLKFSVVKIDGTILSSYPYEPNGSSQLDPAFYIPATERKKAVFFDSQSGAILYGGKPRAAMSVSLVDGDGETVGVLFADIDLVKIKNALEMHANPQNLEYFVLEDKGGKMIINADKAISSATVSFNRSGLNEKFNFRGQRVFELTENIDDLDWQIKINASVDKIFTPTRIVSISIFLIAIESILGMCLRLVFKNKRLF